MSENSYHFSGYPSFHDSWDKKDPWEKGKDKHDKEEDKDDDKKHDKVDNKVDTDVDTKVDTEVDTEVDVEVEAELDLEGYKPSDDDLIDIDHADFDNGLDGLFFANGQDVHQDVHGHGNDAAFNMQEVNALVDNDNAHDIKIKAEDDAFKEDFKLKAFGGDAEAKAKDIDADIDDAGSIAEAGVATADASINQEAFTQNITQGANIQFNEVSVRNVGDDMEDSVVL